jgi:hypothetical protein
MQSAAKARPRPPRRNRPPQLAASSRTSRQACARVRWSYSWPPTHPLLGEDGPTGLDLAAAADPVQFMLFRIDQTTAANRAKTLAVPYYQFALDDGSGREDLGGMALTDDAEAIAFANQVINDLTRQADRSARWSMDITEGERIVGTIAFELGHTALPRISR